MPGDSPDETKRKPLPIWARALITFVLGAIISLAAATIGTVVFLRTTLQHSQDPRFIARVAQDVARFPDPLPKGYSYIFGVDLGLVKIISIDYENGKQQFAFFTYDNKQRLEEGMGIPSLEGSAAPIGSESRGPSPQEKSLDRAYECGVNTFKVQARFSNMISRGSWLIQGVQIPYRLGKLADNRGTGLIACIADQRSAKETLFYAVQEGKDFDMKICTNFLQDIKGF